MFPTLATSKMATGPLGTPRMGWIPLLFLVFACCCCSTALGHLGSLAEGPYPPSFGCCGYARLSHPRIGDVKSPVLPYSRRVARDPSQNTRYYDGDDENSRYANFRPPSFQHKFPQARLSKFYQSTGRGSGGSGAGQQPLPLLNSKMFANGQQPTLKELLHSLHNPELEASAEQAGAGMDNDEAPTFTPYIGARALSNMKEFFEHLQENIEALHKDEDEQEVSSGSSENGGNSEQNYDVRALPSTANFRSEWKPHALGDHGLKKIRSFLPFINQESTRSRLGTNLGLGRRRR